MSAKEQAARHEPSLELGFSERDVALDDLRHLRPQVRKSRTSEVYVRKSSRPDRVSATEVSDLRTLQVRKSSRPDMVFRLQLADVAGRSDSPSVALKCKGGGWGARERLLSRVDQVRLH